LHWLRYGKSWRNLRYDIDKRRLARHCGNASDSGPVASIIESDRTASRNSPRLKGSMDRVLIECALYRARATMGRQKKPGCKKGAYRKCVGTAAQRTMTVAAVKVQRIRAKSAPFYFLFFLLTHLPFLMDLLHAG